jgi:hypothetical protein
MGCGESTGKAEGNTAIAFKKTNCKSIDELFDSAMELVDDMTTLESDLQDAKADFFKATGFEMVPAASKSPPLSHLSFRTQARLQRNVPLLRRHHSGRYFSSES